MRYLITTLILCIFSNSISYSQSNLSQYQKLRDSLQVLHSLDTISFFKITTRLTSIGKKLKSPQKQADVLGILGVYYYFRSDVGKANFYYDSALAILKKFPDRKLKNLIEIKRSYILLNQGNFKKAKELYKSKELNESADTVAQILLNIAYSQIYQAETKHDSSLIKLYKALNLALLKKDLYYEATTRTNIAGEYQLLVKHEDALRELLIALKIAEKLNNKKLATIINENISHIFLNQNKIKEALEKTKANLEFYINTEFYYELSYVYFHLSVCYLKMHNTIEFERCSDLAIKTIILNKVPSEVIKIYTLVFQNYLADNKPGKAIDIAKKTIYYSIKNNEPIYDPLFYKNLSMAYEAINDNVNALKMYKRFINKKDSLDEISNNTLVNSLIYKHDLSEKEQRIKLKEKENSLLKTENELHYLYKTYYLIISGVIIILFIVFVFFINTRKEKKQKELYASQLVNDIDVEREKIAMDLHDDLGLKITMTRQKIIKNGLSNNDTKEDIVNDLNNLLEKTRKISRDLFPSTLKLISFKEFISDLMTTIENQTGIICSYEISNTIESLNLNTKTHILRILQECIQNTVKHSRATAIRIEVEEMNTKKIQIKYLDNGIGFKQDLKHTGVGLKNIHQRALIIKANVSIQNNINAKGINLILILNDKF